MVTLRIDWLKIIRRFCWNCCRCTTAVFEFARVESLSTVVIAFLLSQPSCHRSPAVSTNLWSLFQPLSSLSYCLNRSVNGICSTSHPHCSLVPRLFIAREKRVWYSILVPDIRDVKWRCTMNIIIRTSAINILIRAHTIRANSYAPAVHSTRSQREQSMERCKLCSVPTQTKDRRNLESQTSFTVKNTLLISVSRVVWMKK